MRACLLVVACACGSSVAPPPAAPTAACAPAYADYAAKWSSALRQDLAALSFEEGGIEEVIVVEIATLPWREELVKLRATYRIVETFIADAAWPIAYAAADAAIERCGEGAGRPH